MEANHHWISGRATDGRSQTKMIGQIQRIGVVAPD